VEVLISKEGTTGASHIHMQIVDDGIGFTAAGSKRNFGLQTMRERAEGIGGSLLIDSEYRKGTRIECRLPCLQQERMQKQSLVIR
jgi:signal transduction histidine kinase